MFALEVTEELDSWPEQSIHKRKWVSVQKIERKYAMFSQIICLFLHSLHMGSTFLVIYTIRMMDLSWIFESSTAYFIL